MSLYKRDARSENTEKKLKQSFISLCEKKDIKKITVAELCKACDVNRGTFYNHFKDIDGIIESIEIDIFDQVKSNVSDIKVFSCDEDFFKRITELIKSNIKVVRLISKENLTHNNLLRRVYHYVREKYISDITEYNTNVSAKEAYDLFTYTFGGTIALFLSNLDDVIELEAVSNTANYYNCRTINSFIKDRT